MDQPRSIFYSQREEPDTDRYRAKLFTGRELQPAEITACWRAQGSKPIIPTNPDAV